MKKLLLLLFIGIVGIGNAQTVNIPEFKKNEKLNLLLKLNLCVSDENNNPDDIPICDNDDYSVYSLKDYLIVFAEHEYYCGSIGCSIYSVKKEGGNFINTGYEGMGWFLESNPEFILYTEKDGDEYTTWEITIINNEARHKVIKSWVPIIEDDD